MLTTAHSLDIQLIAEGIESRATYEVLSALQVDGMQGFYLATPQAE
jgi:EAL domain-containing protein (putative c-di-GMP-specific phosphodiesterase class I)